MIRVILPISHVPLDYFFGLGLSLPERVKVSVAKRQHEFMTGRLCAFQAISYLDEDLSRAVNCDKHHLPIWPRGLVGSISHSDFYAVALVGSNINYASMGVDIEHMCLNPHTIDSINDLVINSDEHKMLAKFDQYNKLLGSRLRITIFSAKESFYKCLYLQINKYIDFKSIHVTEINEEKKFMRLCYGDKSNPFIKDLKVNYIHIDDISSILTYAYIKSSQHA